MKHHTFSSPTPVRVHGMNASGGDEEDRKHPGIMAVLVAVQGFEPRTLRI